MGVNDRVLNFQVAHQIDLVRASNRQEAVLRGLLAKSDDDIAAILARIEDPASLTPLRLDRILERVDRRLKKLYPRYREEFNTYLRDLTVAEVDVQETLLTKLFEPIEVPIERTSLGAAARRVRTTPMRGATPREWLNGFFVADRRRLHGAIRAGVADELPTARLITSVLGTVGSARKGGARETSRRSSDTMTQTATDHAAAAAAEEVYSTNSDRIAGVRWVSMLDGKTSPICRSLDGKRFPIDEGRRPPAHFGCRSGITPIVKGLQALDPGKTSAQAEIDFDGKPPQVLTYREWFAGRSERFQRQVLGPTRFKLFQTGQIGLEKFVNDRGVQLTLAELRRKVPELFEEAGIALVRARAAVLPPASKAIVNPRGRLDRGVKERFAALPRASKRTAELTVAERKAVKDYTNFGSARINPKLRRRGATGKLGDKFNRVVVDGLDAAIKKSPLSEDWVLYRGLKRTRAGKFAELRLGETFTDPGFQSWSADRSIVTRFAKKSEDVIFRVRAAAGQPALFVDSLEAEFILPRGTTYRVVEIEENVSVFNFFEKRQEFTMKRRVITLEIVED